VSIKQYNIIRWHWIFSADQLCDAINYAWPTK